MAYKLSRRACYSCRSQEWTRKHAKNSEPIQTNCRAASELKLHTCHLCEYPLQWFLSSLFLN